MNKIDVKLFINGDEISQWHFIKLPCRGQTQPILISGEFTYYELKVLDGDFEIPTKQQVIIQRNKDYQTLTILYETLDYDTNRKV